MTDRMTKDELRELIRETVKESVEETFLRLGVATNDPIEVQKDFQHLRDWRLTSQSIKMKVLASAFGLLVTGGLAALWVGLKDQFLK
jgi:hypothetical protein